MVWSPDRDVLRDRVALGEAGATVICTGRSSTVGAGAIRSDYDRAETIEETAELVSRIGGVGISVYYDLAKVAVNRLGFSQGHELEPHGATAVAVTPGWLRSEMMLDSFGVTEDNWRDALDGAVEGYPPAPDEFAASESPRYVGRAIAALAADSNRAQWNQHSVTSAELAREYGFTDIDGSQPDSWARHH